VGWHHAAFNRVKGFEQFSFVLYKFLNAHAFEFRLVFKVYARRWKGSLQRL